MDRERLTITLKRDLLKKLDDFIDGSEIRNRSHAIEHLLSHSLLPKIEKALILAGGVGVKMRPLTYEMPKSLIPVHGIPITEYTITLLRDFDIRNIVFAISHLGTKIKEHFDDGSKYGVRISYSEEKKALGTGGALRLARPLLKERFLVIHGDILVSIDLNEFLNFHESHQGLATMALSTVVDPSDYGTVKLRGGKVLDFIEKPKKGKQVSQLINAGIYIFEPEIFQFIPKSGLSLLEDVFPKLARQGKLFGFPFEGDWFDVSTPSEYEQALKNWKREK